MGGSDLNKFFKSACAIAPKENEKPPSLYTSEDTLAFKN